MYDSIGCHDVTLDNGSLADVNCTPSDGDVLFLAEKGQKGVDIVVPKTAANIYLLHDMIAKNLQ